MKYYLGVDGGGTKTSAVAIDENNNVINRQVGKTINFYSVGMEIARENLREINDKIFRETEINCFDGVFIGCSALDCEADEKTTQLLCHGIIKSRKIKMNSDTYIALKSADSDSCPVVAICGTGSMVLGENEDGELFTSGGWGHILGDEGSAYSIALSALKKCCTEYDKGNFTSLTQCACDYFRLSDYKEIIPLIYSPETSKDKVAGFAESVCALADKGDEVCIGIVKSEAVSLFNTASVVLEKVKNCQKIGLYGGVFRENKSFSDEFKKQLKLFNPKIKAELLKASPEEAASRLAREL